MTKKKIYIAVGILTILFLFYSFFSNDENSETTITSVVQKGLFKSEVIISGEALSTSSKKIKGPENLMKFKLRSVKIQDLIPEGTVVSEGDYVGRLDPSEINEQIIDQQLNLETAQSKYTQQKLDTTLSLKKERNAIKDLVFTLEETRLELKQSIYEPPATIRKLEITLEKSERELKEKREDYAIKEKQAQAKMVEVGTELSKINKQLKALTDLIKTFTIFSDSNGMLTYAKEWNGNKKKVGSSISPWDPTIANLPDLTKMKSKTYANEVDIRKMEKGLKVKIGFDAFPDIELDGIVTQVANVGEKKRGSDIKIFPIQIEILNTNDNIRPGMTTSNRILTFEKEDALSIPIEGVFVKDSVNFAYVKSGFSIEKKEIVLGESNNDYIIVNNGLKERDVIFLTEPEGLENKSIKLLK